jgi:hypothetical protein
MKILKPFTKWWSKTGEESKTRTKTLSFDYRKAIREQQDRERLEKWRKEFKKMRDHSNYNLGTSYRWTNTYPRSFDIDSNADHTTTDTALKVDGTIEVQGRDILKELDEMRDALLLLKRDVDMESKYPRLRELKDEYERALEKYKTFEAIKESK